MDPCSFLYTKLSSLERRKSSTSGIWERCAGCILSPLVFNIYAEKIMREALDKWEGGIGIGGRVVTNLRYADDTTLIAGTKDDRIEICAFVVEN